MIKSALLTIALLSQLSTASALTIPVTLLPTKSSNDKSHSLVPEKKLLTYLFENFKGADLREIRAQVISNENQKPDHLLVYLFSKKFHRVDFAAVKLDENYNPLSKQDHYQLQAGDNEDQPLTTPTCPDESVQFLAVCPNNNSLELNVTNQVAAAAQNKGLNTVTLLVKQATAQAYLNYMSCPNLVGNFYDGDANTTAITSNDGEISSVKFKTLLKSSFRHKVTNIWLACEAYNDPMLSAVKDDDQSQKYAAGKNDLQVGPSDNAAACAMEAAIDGKPMTAAFNDCYTRIDNHNDQWGFDGAGSDYFGK